MLKLFCLVCLFIPVTVSFAQDIGQSPSPLYGVSNRPWLERSFKQNIIEGYFSKAPKGFNEEGFNSFFNLTQNINHIYGLTYDTRKEFSSFPRYNAFLPNLSITNTAFGDLSFLYLKYLAAGEKKAYALVLQFNEKLIDTQDKELSVIFRPVYHDANGERESDKVQRVTEFLVLLAGDLKYQTFRGSIFTTFANYSHQAVFLDTQTEMIDLTSIDGLQNMSPLARYLVGGHVGYDLTRWGVNFTYANMWTSRNTQVYSLYPTLYYRFHRNLTVRLAFQRVNDSEDFGTRDYGLISLTFGKDKSVPLIL